MGLSRFALGWTESQAEGQHVRAEGRYPNEPRGFFLKSYIVLSS